LWICTRYLGEDGGCVFLVGDLAGHSEYGIDRHAHCEFLTVAVVDHAAARRDFNGALLLARRLTYKVTVTIDLEVCETDADQQHPAEQDASENEKAGLCAAGRGGICHRLLTTSARRRLEPMRPEN